VLRNQRESVCVGLITDDLFPLSLSLFFFFFFFFFFFEGTGTGGRLERRARGSRRRRDMRATEYLHVSRGNRR